MKKANQNRLSAQIVLLQEIKANYGIYLISSSDNLFSNRIKSNEDSETLKKPFFASETNRFTKSVASSTESAQFFNLLKLLSYEKESHQMGKTQHSCSK